MRRVWRSSASEFASDFRSDGRSVCERNTNQPHIGYTLPIEEKISWRPRCCAPTFFDFRWNVCETFRKWLLGHGGNNRRSGVLKNKLAGQ